MTDKTESMETTCRAALAKAILSQPYPPAVVQEILQATATGISYAADAQDYVIAVFRAAIPALKETMVRQEALNKATADFLAYVESGNITIH